jgi:hypothetical protein
MATTTTNVLNLQGEYKIKALNGNVTIDTGLSTSTKTIIESTNNVWNPHPEIGPEGRLYNPDDVYGADVLGSIEEANEQRTKGALFIKGGVGIQKDLNVGGWIYGRVDFSNTTTFVQFTNTNIDQEFNLTFINRSEQQPAQDSLIYVDQEGVAEGLRYNPAQGRITTDRAIISETDESTSTQTGALIVNGGVGIVKNVVVGGEVLPEEDLTGSIGNSGTNWAEAYIHDIYTRVIKSTTGTVQIAPAAGVTEIIGDIRVRGTNPIGTAPVVTNTLYVTMDGDDTNDGRAMDPSRACRTIGGALNSPYYQPGTQIRVSAGHYLEDNPLQLKPYTSIMGSDIRTTSIEPINKTQDLFHLNSGCYLAFMQFLNGRSGLLEGEYAPEFNRGAYCTAFPPLEGEDRIDLYHSPYIQNCTNLSGPWLKDGTMFVPNQTVQVPSAVGVGTWPAGTSTIVVDAVLGSIQRGDTINAGQQNPGFFDARTLMLANKQFMQEQVVAYVDSTFSSGTFVYDEDKCARDTGLIVDSIMLDMLQNSTSDSIFAGLQYWRQDGYVDAIGDQFTQTIDAINFVKTQAVATLTNMSNVVEASIISDRFDDILRILNTNTNTLATGEFSQWVTDSIISNGTETTEVSVIESFNALIAAKDAIAAQTIEYINSTLTPFVYDSVKCSRDTGLIVDAIAQDLLFEGTTQSTFAGLQYWNQAGYVGGIAEELTTTTAAISYIRDLAMLVVVGDTSGTRYQTSVPQVTNLTTATSAESALIETDFNKVLDILTFGTGGVTDTIVPNGINPSSNINVSNAYRLLQANKVYLQAEAIAFVETTKTVGFEYDKARCSRDVGYIVDSVSFDLLYGGNKQAVQSGVYYYGYNDGDTAIPNEVPQTIAAYNLIKKLIAKIIRNIEIPPEDLYQPGNLQEAGTPATPIEVEQANKLVDIIIDIINNGTTRAAAPKPISLNRSTSQYNVAAAQILHDNREFIQNEVIAYVNTLYTFMYNEETCFRDVGYMIDSVAFDLLHPSPAGQSNKQSIKAGVYYFGYNNTTTEIPNEIPQTAAAYSFIKLLLPSIVKAEKIPSPGQTGTVQVTNLPFATDNEIELLNSKIDVITDIIRNGPSAVEAKIPMGLEQSKSSNIYNAFKLLEANRPFIQAEVIAYLNDPTTFATFKYSKEFCYRDVGILIENVAYDAAFGGDEKSIESGLAYYDGVESRISGQNPQTIAAIDYLNQMVQSIIVNATWTNILPVPIVVAPQGTHPQVRNTVLTNGNIASRTIGDLFNKITTIIETGPNTAASANPYTGTNADAAYVSAEVLMQSNRSFIQEDTINYINNLVQDFPYSENKCRRDTGLIIDSVAFDLLYPTNEHSQSTFAGLQYWNQENYVGDIENQLAPTVDAITYLRDLSVKIIQNITPADDLVVRYQNTFTQVTSLEPGTELEAVAITENFNSIIEIVDGNNKGWTDKIVPNGKESPFLNVRNAVSLLQANKEYLAYEVTAFVDATTDQFVYDAATCRRDVGYIVDAISFDLLHSGNRQSVQAGLYYFGFSTDTTAIRNQEVQTTAAFDYLASIASQVIQGIPVARKQRKIDQVVGDNLATSFEADLLVTAINTITDIISTGPSVAATSTPIAFTASTTATVMNAFDLLYANKDFLIEEVIAHIDETYNPNSFNYDEALCYRDIGLIVDAVSQDILIGGNYKSIEAGLAYWNYGVSHVIGQETTTTMAINYARDLALQIIGNQPVTPQPQTISKQIILPFFQYGGDYMPQQSVRRNFDIITTIINRGPTYAPSRYMGGGVFPLTGINGADVLNPPVVVSVTTQTDGTFLIGLNTSTIGFGTNATLYFGETLTYPRKDSEVEALSLEYTGNASTWNQRKTDPIGSMGGSLVDGAVISARSPIQSFVYDAFTQLTQGGRGVHIRNDGYAQLVSVFTIFSSVGVQTDTGGIASIVNSNANFGDVCLLAKGYGKRKFSGQIYNPSFRAYPESPNIPGGDYLDQYYPFGFWPNNAQIAVYMPDPDDRPHISLVMEIVPPDGYQNEYSIPEDPNNRMFGFANAAPTTSTLTTGTITLKSISTEGVAVGNTLYIRDRFGSQFDNFTYLHDTDGNPIDLAGNIVPVEQAPANPNFGMWYAATGTIVTDVGYDSIRLSNALVGGGGDPGNPNYFDLYFCGNAYYTVLSSEVISNPQYTDNVDPIPLGVNILSTEATGADTSQVPAHVAALQHLNTLTVAVINNADLGDVNQVRLPLVKGGGDAQTFIDLRFGEIIDIVNSPDLKAAENVIKPALRTTEGPAVQGGGAAITLIEANIDFLANKVNDFVQSNFTSQFTYDEEICRRDAGYILEGVFYDTALGTNWNSVYSGIAYRRGTSLSVITNELSQTVGAINFLQDNAATIMADNPVAVERSNASFYETINILSEGESAANELVFPTPTNISATDNKVKAKNLLVANKAFIKAELIAWINNQINTGSGSFNGFTYNSETCARDVGFIVDSLCYDILYGGNSATVISARAYYDGAVTVIPGETDQTAAALDQLSTIVQNIVQGIEITPTTGNLLIQDRGPSPATIFEADALDALLQVIQDVVLGSPVPATSYPDITWVNSEILNAVGLLNDNQLTLINNMIAFINDEYVGTFNYDSAQCIRDVKTILQRLIYDLQSGGRYNSVLCGLAYWNRPGTYYKISLGENITRTELFPHNATVNFYQRSYMSASGYVFEYVGAGTNYGALPQRGVADPVQSKETVQLDGGKVFFTSTDQNGDFRIGPGLVISQATGVLSGRTFTRSLYANMTPFILAIEAGQG